MNRSAWWLVHLLLLAAPVAAHADVDALVSRGIAYAQSLAGRAPAENLAIHVSGGEPALLLRHARVWIDGRELPRYEYSEVEGRALAAGAAHAFGGIEIEPGDHRVRAEVVALDPAAPPYAPRTRTQVEGNVAVPTGGRAAIELRLARGKVRGASLALSPVPGGESMDARVAQFLLADGRPFEAAALAPAVLELKAALVDPARAQGWIADRAAVARGESLLANHQGAAAAEVFRQVRSPGPFATRALLGIGWSALLPAGARDAPIDPGLRAASYAPSQSEDAIAQARRRAPFRYLDSVAAGDRADDVRTALVAWMELVGRDPFDPAVQQGLLAVPYALHHIGAQRQSAEYAERAVAQLEAALTLLERATGAVETDLVAMIDAYLDDERNGWHWQPGGLSPAKRWWLGDAPERNHYAGVLLDDPAFVAALQDYRTLYLLIRFLDRNPGEPALHADAQTSIGLLGAQLRARARGLIDARRSDTARNLAEAHLWLARLNDREPDKVASR